LWSSHRCDPLKRSSSSPWYVSSSRQNTRMPLVKQEGRARYSEPDTNIYEPSSEEEMSIPTGTEQRYRRLFDAYHERVYVYCRRRTDVETARECASETFLIAWRRIDDVPPDDRALRWLYGVARRVLANRFRSQRRSRRLISRLGGLRRDPAPSPEVVVVRRSEDQEILDALACLRPQDQELLRLAVWEELPHAEIGEVLGCSAHAVDQRIRRAENRLASELRRSGHRHQHTTAPNPSSGEPT
jgi:RNA polymerase sigma-70 factor (ECF subfamily)